MPHDEARRRFLRGLLGVIDNDRRTVVTYETQHELFLRHIEQEGYGISMKQAQVSLVWFARNGGVLKRDNETWIQALWRGKSKCVPQESLAAIGYVGGPTEQEDVFTVTGSCKISTQGSISATSTISSLTSTNDISSGGSSSAPTAQHDVGPSVPALEGILENGSSIQSANTHLDLEPLLSQVAQKPSGSTNPRSRKQTQKSPATMKSCEKRSSHDAGLDSTSPQSPRPVKQQYVITATDTADSEASPGTFTPRRSTAISTSSGPLSHVKVGAMAQPPSLPVVGQLDHPADLRTYEYHHGRVAPETHLPQTTGIDLNKLPKRMSSLYESAREAFTSLLHDALKLPTTQLCPKPESASKDLLTLLMRCLGLTWDHQYDQLRRRNLPMALDFLPSIFHAMLYDRILGNDLNWQLELSQSMGLSGGRSYIAIVVRAVQALGSGPSPATSRSVEGAIAQALFDAINQPSPVFTSYVEKLAAEMLETMRPLLEKLEKIAANLNGANEINPWEPNLLQAFKSLVEKTMRLKIDLCRANEQHTFFWPGNGEVLDVGRMKPLEAGTSSRQLREVVFTTFPGIEVFFPSRNETKRPCLAIVASRVRAGGQQAGPTNV